MSKSTPIQNFVKKLNKLNHEVSSGNIPTQNEIDEMNKDLEEAEIVLKVFLENNKGIHPELKQTFRQNALWLDKTVEVLEKRGVAIATLLGSIEAFEKSLSKVLDDNTRLGDRVKATELYTR